MNGYTISFDATGDAFASKIKRADDARNQGKLAECAAICRRILQRDPRHLRALTLLGICLEDMHQHDEAIARLREVLGIAINIPVAHACLCNIYRKLDRIDEAKMHARYLYQLQPDNANNLAIIGLVLEESGDLENSRVCITGAICRKKDHADAHMALAQILIAEGEWDAGWHEYEWRELTEAGKQARQKYANWTIQSAPWTGFRIKRETEPVFILGDQGFGDTIQFARYLPLVAQRCAKVIVGCSQEIQSLISRIPGVAFCTHKWTEIPKHAAHRSISSMPLIFRTRPDDVPPAPYISADPVKAAQWREKLPRARTLVGIKWAGREGHPNNHRRSCSLETLLPLFDVPGVTLVSLQVPTDPADAALLARYPNVIDPHAELHDWEDTAGLVANLSLVISVDTGVAHLAGAMGVPCWTMLPFFGEWRWGTTQTTTPWYSSMTLYRQAERGNWPELIGRVAHDLAQLARPQLRLVS